MPGANTFTKDDKDSIKTQMPELASPAPGDLPLDPPPSSPLPVSSAPSSPPSPPVLESLFEAGEGDHFTYPQVAMHGDTAIVTRSYTDIQFFAIADSGLELIRKMPMVFYPEWIDFDGDTVVITSRDVQLTPQFTYKSLGPGDVHVYERGRYGIWSEAARFRPLGFPREGIGPPAAVDGDVLVLGIPQSHILRDDERYPGYMEERDTRHPGPVRVYRRLGAAWQEQARLTPPGNATALFSSGAVTVRGTSIVVGDRYHGRGEAGAIFAYELDPSTGSWNSTGGALLNSDCHKHFGHYVKIINGEELLATCKQRRFNSYSFAIYHYMKSRTSEGFVLRQTIVFDELVRSIEIDGRAMIVSENRVGRSSVIHVFVRKHDLWEKNGTFDEPATDATFGYRTALSGNHTLIASWENVYLVRDFFRS